MSNQPALPSPGRKPGGFCTGRTGPGQDTGAGMTKELAPTTGSRPFLPQVLPQAAEMSRGRRGARRSETVRAFVLRQVWPWTRSSGQVVGSGWQPPLLWQEAESRHWQECAAGRVPGSSRRHRGDPSPWVPPGRAALCSAGGNGNVPGPLRSFHRRTPRQDRPRKGAGDGEGPGVRGVLWGGQGRVSRGRTGRAVVPRRWPLHEGLLVG